MKAIYVKTALESILNVSKIVTIHYYEFDKNFIFDGETHNFWEMVYIDKGEVLVRQDEEEHILRQGEIIFHKPNEFHSIRAHNSSPNFFVISFVCNSPAMRYFEKYSAPINKTLKPFIESILSEAELTYEIPKNDPSLKKLVKKQNAAIGSEQLIKTYLEQLMILFIRNMNEKREANVFPSKKSMETHLVSSVKKLISSDKSASLRVSEICDTLGYSKSYLSKLFREQTGDTISHYANVEKIERAKLLIREGQLNFSEISDELNFDNPQYFSRVFKRITNMTPTEFKTSLNFKKRF